MAGDKGPRRVGLTRRGKLVVVEGVLLYLFARGVSIDELYALALAAIVFPLFAMGFVALRRHRVVLSRSIAPRRAFAGGAIRFSYGIANRTALTTPPVLLEDACPRALGGTVRVALPSLPPDRQGSMGVERTVAHRGRWTVGPLEARIEDPFGLASVRIGGVPAAAVVVYPRIEVLPEASQRHARAGGGNADLYRLATQGEDFYGIRDWQSGDDLRKVHWRSSAKRGSLQIRQDEVRPFPRATVVLDTALDDPRALEWAISAAASAVWEFARQGFGVRMATNTIAPARHRWGREAADPLLTALAGAEATPAVSLLPTIKRVASRTGAGGILVAVLTGWEAGSMPALARARTLYDWAGAVIVDQGSFSGVSGRERAEQDQRIAEGERTLARAGWRVVTAGSTDGIGNAWTRLTDAGTSRLSSPSRHL